LCALSSAVRVREMPNANDIYYLEPAKQGDLDVLLKYIAEGGEVTPAMKEFLAGKPKRRRGQPKVLDRFERDEFVATYVRRLEHDGLNPVAAVKRAMGRFGMSESGVYRAKRLFANYGLIMEDFQG
jgi:hypothetical protein